MSARYTILIVNPGSTSTKLAICAETHLGCVKTIHHPPPRLAEFSRVWSQFSYRLELCREWATDHLKICDAVVSVGGLLRPLQSGTYLVNEKMIHDAESNVQGEHASNLGCALAYRLASEFRALPIVVDPVSVDEFEPLAYYSGHPLIKRRSLSHAISIHAVAHRAVNELRLPLRNSSFVVCHLGGGISVAAVRNGRIIDVNDAASDGPFSPERTGGIPLQPLINLCFSGKCTQGQVKSMIMGRGGLVAYLGTNSTEEVEHRVGCGDVHAKEVYEAMAYQIAKEIGAMATVLNGFVDAIVLTGGAAHSCMFIGWIEERVKFIAPVIVYQGEDEMQSLANGALRVLRGEESAKEY